MPTKMESESGEKDKPVKCKSMPGGATRMLCWQSKVRASTTLKYVACSEKDSKSTEPLCENLTTRQAPFWDRWKAGIWASLRPSWRTSQTQTKPSWQAVANLVELLSQLTEKAASLTAKQKAIIRIEDCLLAYTGKCSNLLVFARIAYGMNVNLITITHHSHHWTIRTDADIIDSKSVIERGDLIHGWDGVNFDSLIIVTNHQPNIFVSMLRKHQRVINCTTNSSLSDPKQERN